jgi:8-amino-7-oxononanoate synthase
VRTPQTLKLIDATRALWRGRELSYFGGSDYLRMSWHPEVRAACEAGVREHGPSASASRMTTGNLSVYEILERELAKFFGAAEATLASCGYLAPMVAAQALAPDFHRVLLDERAHACLVDAAVMTGLPITHFPHRSPRGLKQALRGAGSRSRALVMTDGLFNSSGEIAPLGDYLEILPEGAALLVDDAHGAGILGKRGRGTTEVCGVSARQIVLTCTLSKAFGCYGGVILGGPGLRARILERSRVFTGNTSTPPPMAAGALAALGVFRREGAERRARLAAHASAIKERLMSAGVNVGRGPGPMFSLAPAGEGAADRLRKELLKAGVFPTYIAYPQGPAERYFRFAVSSEHSAAQVEALSDALHEFYRK